MFRHDRKTIIQLRQFGSKRKIIQTMDQKRYEESQLPVLFFSVRKSARYMN